MINMNMNRDSDQKLERRKKVPKGVALIIVIAVMLCLAILAGVILAGARRYYHVTGSQIKRTKAYYLAEGGIQAGLTLLRETPPDDLPPRPFVREWNLNGDDATGDGGNETIVTFRDRLATDPPGVLYRIESRVNPVDMPAK